MQEEFLGHLQEESSLFNKGKVPALIEDDHAQVKLFQLFGFKKVAVLEEVVKDPQTGTWWSSAAATTLPPGAGMPPTDGK